MPPPRKSHQSQRSRKVLRKSRQPATAPSPIASDDDAPVWGAGRPGGIGIVLGELEDRRLLMGIDLDGSLNPESEKLKSWAKKVLDRFGTYAEVSPSGKGFKIFFLVAARNVGAVVRLMEEPKTGKSRLRFAFVASEHIEIALDRGRVYTITDQWLEDWPETLRTVSVEDVRWLISEAGPRFLEQHGIRSRNAERSSGPHDESGSGHGFRFMLKRKAAGDSFREACKAILADRGKAGEWARRSDKRQLKRAWENNDASHKLESRNIVRVADVEMEETRWFLATEVGTWQTHHHGWRPRPRKIADRHRHRGANLTSRWQVAGRWGCPDRQCNHSRSRGRSQRHDPSAS
jgi:hypothetical protein